MADTKEWLKYLVQGILIALLAPIVMKLAGGLPSATIATVNTTQAIVLGALVAVSAWAVGKIKALR